MSEYHLLYYSQKKNFKVFGFDINKDKIQKLKTKKSKKEEESKQEEEEKRRRYF